MRSPEKIRTADQPVRNTYLPPGIKNQGRRWIVAVAAGWGVETALAAPPTPEPALAVEHAEHTISAATQVELDTFFDRSVYETAGIEITTIDSADQGEQSPYSDAPYRRTEQLDGSAFVDHLPVLIEDDTTTITFKRTIERAHCTMTADWKQNTMGTDEAAGLVGQYDYTDQYGNHIFVLRGLPADTTQPCFELITVTTPFQYETTKAANNVPVQMDFTPIGNTNLDGAFYRQVVPLRGTFDHHPVFSSDVSQQEAQALIDGGSINGKFYAGMQGTLDQGIRWTTSLYGLPRELVQHIHIVDTGFIQAEAIGQTDAIIFHADILRDADGITSRDTRIQLVNHEANHLIDVQYEVSSDSRFKALWESIPKDMLPLFNESHFIPGGFGGHAEDSPAELYASFITGLDDDRPLAERLAAQDPAFRKVYHEVAKLVKTILQEKAIADSAKIMGLLDQAITLSAH